MWVGDKAYSDLMRELWGSTAMWNKKKRTYLEVARRLGVDEETIRNRVKHMKESGFLLGWRLVPNPMLLSRRPALVLLDLQDGETKEETIGRLREKDGVITIVSIYSDGLLVVLFDEDDGKASSTTQITELGVRASALSVPQMRFPNSTFRMSTTDWEISGMLIRDAERGIVDVAAGVKVSPRTVRRRLNAMMDASAILIMPIVSLRKSSGISYQLIVQCEDGKKDQVDALVASRIDNLVFRADASGNGSIFGFTGSNIAEGNELLGWVRRLPAVRSAKMNIVEEVVHVFDWLEREVERRSMIGKPAEAATTAPRTDLR